MMPFMIVGTGLAADPIGFFESFDLFDQFVFEFEVGGVVFFSTSVGFPVF
jgi:hypothetical protein